MTTISQFICLALPFLIHFCKGFSIENIEKTETKPTEIECINDPHYESKSIENEEEYYSSADDLYDLEKNGIDSKFFYSK